jgi:hypothetical protein
MISTMTPRIQSPAPPYIGSTPTLVLVHHENDFALLWGLARQAHPAGDAPGHALHPPGQDFADFEHGPRCGVFFLAAAADENGFDVSFEFRQDNAEGHFGNEPLGVLLPLGGGLSVGNDGLEDGDIEFPEEFDRLRATDVSEKPTRCAGPEGKLEVDDSLDAAAGRHPEEEMLRGGQRPFGSAPATGVVVAENRQNDEAVMLRA